MKSILVSGAFGLVGSELVVELQKKYGIKNVIALQRNKFHNDFQGIVEKGDVRDFKFIEGLVRKYNVGTIYHLAGLLSVGSEKQPDLAWDINVNGLINILNLSRRYKIKVFWPSSIAAFGNTTPKLEVPQHTIMEPTTIYGVSKVTGELLCQYYHNRYRVDVRSIRYPGLNGFKADPGDGTTEYAIHIFYGLIKKNSYRCYLKPDAKLPMMYMDDAIRGTIELMEASPSKISVRTGYNLAAISFTPEELVAEIKKLSPNFRILYKPDHRQKIAESWPKTIDDSKARKDWGWREEYDLARMTRVLYEGVKTKLAVKKKTNE
ncbi:NAD-dependent epimerase/dehydratase family protein [Patescibacteria group bacterium]|nr:NAD-dependent epimerase/dehydratase family protein [Patescibacteria group bacterium]